MQEKNLYVISLVSIWHWIWGGMLALVGVLIMFNVQDTYFPSDGAVRELTVKAAIVGTTTLVCGLALLCVGAGIWLVRAWAWWTGVVIGAVAIVSDLANFARLSADLSMITDDRFAERVAAWPILMWDERISFLGTHQNQLLFVGWPILLHLVITLPVVLFLLAPQVRESFVIGAASGATGAASGAFGFAAQRRVEAFVFTPPCDNSPALVQALHNLNFPFVQLTPHERCSNCAWVAATDEAGSYQAACHLIELGHTRIGFIDRKSTV